MGTKKATTTPKVNKRKNRLPAKPVQEKEQKPTGDKNQATYELFCEFMALPSVVRSGVFKNPKTGEGIDSQREFAEAYGIYEPRLSEWKRDEDYHNRVSKIRRQYFKGEIGDAIQAVLTNILVNPKGQDLKVLLEYTKEVERDDPTGEVGEQLGAILGKLNKMIPG